jgi:hypothetical protein
MTKIQDAYIRPNSVLKVPLPIPKDDPININIKVNKKFRMKNTLFATSRNLLFTFTLIFYIN